MIDFNEVIDCPICGGQGNAIDRIKTIHPSSDMECGLVSCLICGHWWITPTPTQSQLNKMYEESSEYVVPKVWGKEQEEKVFSKAERLLIDVEGGSQEKKRYLEIGAGGGHLHSYFLNLGWDAYGVEPGAWCSNPNIFKNISDIPNEMTFDVIVAFDVLEHVVDPVAMLSKLKQVSNPDARLYCSFPNCSSLHARVKKGQWRMVRPFGHLHYFSKESVRLALERSGWVLESLNANGTVDLKNKLNVLHLKTLAVGIAEMCGFADQWSCEASSRQGSLPQ